MEFDFENIELEPIRKNEITGIVLSPVKDGQNQVVDAQEIEEACQLWNEAFRHLTVQHRDRNGALLDLESLDQPEIFENCFDQDFQILSSYVVDTNSVLNGESIPGGSWLLSLKVENPEIWELIKEERLNGYSIGGLGIKQSNHVENISNLIVPEISLVASPANQRGFLVVKQLETILNPYPNEHACRLREPGQFQEDSFRRMSRESNGKQYHIVAGRLKGKESLIEQAYRYPIDTWQANEARQHCQKHKGRFEPAKEE